MKNVSLLNVVKRGLFGKCPNCGEGKLFKYYLKQVDKCASCGEKFGHIRADDGPAWISVLVVSHVLVPLAIYVSMNTDWSQWTHLFVWSVAGLLLTVISLPPAKGFFISMIWRTGALGDPAVNKDDKP